MDYRVEFQCRSCTRIFRSSASCTARESVMIGPRVYTVIANCDVVHCKSCMDNMVNKCETLESTYENGIKVSKKRAMNFERNKREVAIVTQDGSNLYLDILLLSSRSEVFEKMFKGNTVEKETGRVTTDDVNTQNLKDFLFFLYEGELREIPSRETLKELLHLAHRFNVKELLQMLDSFIQRLLVKGPCDLELLKLGFSYNLPRTKEFFRANATQEIVDKVYRSSGEDFPWYVEFFKTVLTSPNITWKGVKWLKGHTLVNFISRATF